LGDAAADEGRRGDGHTPEYAIGLGRDRRRARGIRVEREQVTPVSDAKGRLAVGARREGLGRGTDSAGFHGSRSSGDRCTAAGKASQLRCGTPPPA